MEDALMRIGLPLGVIVFAMATIPVAKATLGFIATRRATLATEEIRRKLEYQDRQLAEFYLPLRERLRITLGLFRFFEDLQVETRYDNASLGIQSEDPLALRHIIVRRVYLPLNKEVERLILDRAGWRAPDDPTDYSVLVRHLVLWRGLEEALLGGEISDYKAHDLLAFPAGEVDHIEGVCAKLLEARADVRAGILRFSGVPNLKEVKA